MDKEAVILIFDVGKTNKKILLFNQDYQLVFEESSQFDEIEDEDGFQTEDLSKLTGWVRNTFILITQNENYNIEGIHFSGYGASLVCIDVNGSPVFPLYNYLKPYPDEILNDFFLKYGSPEKLSIETRSPILGNLNSGLQLYRLKKLYPEKIDKVRFALHLPEYLSYVITGKCYSNMTSIGCHTMLWDFAAYDYHKWVKAEMIDKILAPIKAGDEVSEMVNGKIPVGVGLHDSSAALVPYLATFNKPFVLISTGTWCISLNPFNDSPITEAELKKDVLCYITYQGKPVKASRLFAGNEHEIQTRRLAEHFNKPRDFYKTVKYDESKINRHENTNVGPTETEFQFTFHEKDLNQFSDYESAYHALMLSIVELQVKSTNLVLSGVSVKKLFVDGGFGKNEIYMKILSQSYPQLEVYSSVVTQASALGAAMALHSSWNSKPIPPKLISLKKH